MDLCRNGDAQNWKFPGYPPFGVGLKLSPRHSEKVTTNWNQNWQLQYDKLFIHNTRFMIEYLNVNQYKSDFHGDNAE